MTDVDRVQLWVHPNWRFAGGAFDEDAGRAVPGGPWATAVRESVEGFAGDSVAVTNAERGPEDGRHLYEDGDAPTWVVGDHVDRPYGEGWDAVYADPDGGRLPPADAADLVAGYDEVVVRGGYHDDCQRRAVERVAAVVDDGVTVRVDPDLSFGEARRDAAAAEAAEARMATTDDPHDRRATEARTALAAASATEQGVVDAIERRYEGRDVEVGTADQGDPGGRERETNA